MMMDTSDVAGERFIAVAFVNWSGDMARSWLFRQLRKRCVAASAHDVDGIASTAEVHSGVQVDTNTEDRTSDFARVPVVVVRGKANDVRAVSIPTSVPVSIDPSCEVVGCCHVALGSGVRPGKSLAQVEMCLEASVLCASFSTRLRARLQSLDVQLSQDAASIPRSVSVETALLRSRVVTANDRLIALREDVSSEKRMLFRLGRCLERWVPDVSIEYEGAGLLCMWCMSSISFDPHQSIFSSNACYASSNRSLDRSFDFCRIPHVPVLVGSLKGCAKLFRSMHGSEQVLMQRVRDGFARHGFTVRVATSSRFAAAMALARFAPHAHQRSIRALRGRDRCGCQPAYAIPQGCELQALEDVSIEGLRIGREQIEKLRSVEVETIGQLARLRGGGVVERFGSGDEGSARVKDVCASNRHRQGQGAGRRHRVRPKSDQSDTAISSAIPSLFSSEKSNIDLQTPLDCVPFELSTTPMSGSVSLRLEQALGRMGTQVSEPRILLRHQDPVVVEHVFDGPVAHYETLQIACADLIDQLTQRLAMKHEGLRCVRWSLRHADLAADPSGHATNEFVHDRTRQFDGIHQQTSGAKTDVQETVFEIRFGKPAVTRLHHWNLLRPKLEQVCLVYGIEGIRCAVEHSVRLRHTQGVMSNLQRDSVRNCARSSAGGVASMLRKGAVAGASSSVDFSCGDDAWLEVVTARLGEACVTYPRCLSREQGRNERLASFEEQYDCSRRPWQLIEPTEMARFFVRGTPHVAGHVAGQVARHVATAIACRTALHREYESVSGERGFLMLYWRGRSWSVHAIDGWMRTTMPWHHRFLQDVAVQHAHTHHYKASGEVSSRVLLTPRGEITSWREGKSLWHEAKFWIQVRWPERIRVTQQGSRTQYVRNDAGNDAGSDARIDAAIVQQRPSSSVGSMQEACVREYSAQDLWIDRCASALADGVDLVVEGVWG